MFFGSYHHTLDEKGRLLVPSKMRDALGQKAYVLRGYDGALSVYTEADFLKYMDSLESLPFGRRDARDFRRVALSSVSELLLDRQGRLQLPAALLSKYAIGRNVVVIGVLDHIEIWDEGKWAAYLKENEKDFEDKAEALVVK